MLSRHNGGVQLLISSLNSVCWAKASSSHVTASVFACDLLCTSAFIIFHTSSHSDFTLCFFDLSIKILALLPWTTLTIGKHLFQLFPKSLVNPSLYSLDSCCLLSVASNLLTAISYQRLCLLLALLFCLRLALLFLHRFLGSEPGCLFCPSRPSDPRSSAHLLAGSCTVSLSPDAGLRSGYCFSLQARVADFFFCADSWFRLVRVSRARWLLLA